MALVCEALTKQQLQEARCDNPACLQDHPVIWLQPRCHPGAGLDVAYDKRTGLLGLFCHYCDEQSDQIVVAPSHIQ